MSMSDLKLHQAGSPEATPTGQGWFSRRVLLWLSVFLAVLCGTALVFGRQLYRSWKHQGARTLALQAMDEMERGDLEKPIQLLNEAYQINPSEPVVLRSIATLLPGIEGGTTGALPFWRSLVASGKATTDDKASYAEALLKNGDHEEAARVFASLTPAERLSRRGRETQALFLHAEGNVAAARLVLREAVALEPGSPESQFKLAALDQSSIFPETRRSALETLWRLARGRGLTARRAVELLASDAGLTLPHVRELLGIVEEHHGSFPRLRCLVLTALLQRAPMDRDLWLDRELARLEQADTTTQIEVLRWMAAEGGHERVLAHLPLEKAVSASSWFAVRAEALVHAQRWQELRQMLRLGSSLPLQPVELVLLQARCAAGLGEPAESVAGYLREACRTALNARHERLLERAIDVAGTLGHDQVVSDTCLEAAQLPQMRVFALERLLQAQAENRDAFAMIATLEALRSIPRPDTRMDERSIYLRMLVGCGMEVAAREIQPLVEAGNLGPSQGSFLKALSAYRQADSDALHRLVKEVDPEDLSPGQRAVYAGMLHACGETARAYAIAEKIARPLLLDEEARLLARAL